MVSSFKDFLSCRPTEVSEDDLLLCESRYIDSEKQMKKFKGLKRFSYLSKVVEDEIYYFRLVRGAEHLKPQYETFVIVLNICSMVELSNPPLILISSSLLFLSLF